MKYALYKFFFNSLLRLPDSFFETLFTIIFPIYRALHTKRAYGRVEKHLQTTGFSGTSAKDVFKSLYWNGIDSYRLLARLPSATERVRYENEELIKEAVARGPIVALSIHQGAFENLHRSLCRYSEHVHLITNPFQDTALTQALHEIRSDAHLHEYATEEVASILRNLFKTNGILAMVVDQARDTHGNNVELFGIPSTLYLRLPEKANQMGAGIVTFRTWSNTTIGKNGKEIRNHVVRFENYYPPRYCQEKILKKDSVKTAESTLAFEIAHEIETWIKAHPEQWTWNYHGNFCQN